MQLLLECDGEIGNSLIRDLADVEARFSGELLSDLDCVNALSTHVERYRGKMLRPTLVIVSAMACAGCEDLGDLRDPVITAATVCEMVHMATLVHDDILDEAEMRRRGATVNHLHGNEVAVMLGDYLISHAYHLCSDLGRADISRVIAQVTNTVCEGELLQLSNRENWMLDERTYFEIIRRKTASLVGLCCELPTLLAHPPSLRNGDGRVGKVLHGFGEKLGVAFQIIDDLLDLSGDEQMVGKTLGRDLAKGKLTLPLISHLASVPAQEASRLRALLVEGARDADAQVLAQVHDALTTSGAIERSSKRAQDLVADACDSLVEALPDSSARAMMLDMAQAVVSRKF